MNPSSQLIRALRDLALGDATGGARVTPVTAPQRQMSEALWASICGRPVRHLIALTEREGDATVPHFMVGKDALGDGETWVLG